MGDNQEGYENLPGGDRTYDLVMGASGLNHCATPAHTLSPTPLS